MQLASITSGLNLVGVEPGLVVSVVTAVAVGPDSYKLIYQRPAGDYRDRLISQADADAFSVAVAGRPWAFDGNGEAKESLPKSIWASHGVDVLPSLTKTAY
jgi:hypothetical protein